MKRLLIKPAACDLETDRIAAALVARGATLRTLLHDHPATLTIDAIKLKRVAREFDVVHAFGAGALAVALGSTMGSTGGRIVFSPIGFPTRQLAGWLRAILTCRTIEIVCTSDAARRFLVTRGVPIERCHLIRPGANLSAIPTQRNTLLRARFGYTDEHRVLLCPLEITHTSGHGLAMWATSILHVFRPHYRLLVPGTGPLNRLIEEMRPRVLDDKILSLATDVCPEIPIEQLFSAADAVLLTPTHPVAPLTVAMAMASTRPIVATTTPQLCELLEDRHTALLVKEPSPRLVGQRLMDLEADPALGWKIQDRARSEVYDHLTQAKMLQLLATIGQPAAASISLPIATA